MNGRQHTQSFLQSRYALEFGLPRQQKNNPFFSSFFPQTSQLSGLFFQKKKDPRQRIFTTRAKFCVCVCMCVCVCGEGGGGNKKKGWEGKGEKTDWKKSEQNSLSPLLRCRHLMLREAASWHGSKYSLYLLLFEKKKRKKGEKTS